jgi:hypothetical protein
MWDDKTLRRMSTDALIREVGANEPRLRNPAHYDMDRDRFLWVVRESCELLRRVHET